MLDKLRILFSFISIGIILNLLFATIQNFLRESEIDHFGSPDIRYLSSATCLLGTILFINCFVRTQQEKESLHTAVLYSSIIIIFIGTLASGSITYTGEDSPSFVVVFLATGILLIPSVSVFLIKGKKALSVCLLLVFSPTLSYFSSYQWVVWQTKLYAHEVTKIHGWNFEVDPWKWIDLKKIQPKDVIVYNWSPLFRRFAIKKSDTDYYRDRETADILYNVEMVEDKLLITQATHVWWQSSGKTGVWPSR